MKSEPRSVKSTRPGKGVRRHHTHFYFEDGNLTILVENILYRVFRSTFTRHSTVFKDVLSVPQGQDGPQEGTSDTNPFKLDGIKCKDFDALLLVLYPPKIGRLGPFSLEQWISILDLATRWEFQDVAPNALAAIKTLKLNCVDQVTISRRFGIKDEWAFAAYKEVCCRPRPLSFAETKQLGLETSTHIMEIRERILSSKLYSLMLRYSDSIVEQLEELDAPSVVSHLVADRFNFDTTTLKPFKDKDSEEDDS